MNELAFYNRVFAGSLHHATIHGGSLLFEPSRALSALETIARSGAHIAVVECWAGTFEPYAIEDIFWDCLAIDDEILARPDGASAAVALARDYITRSLPPTTTYVSFIFNELLPSNIGLEGDGGDID
jgi:hypothetical protein